MKLLVNLTTALITTVVFFIFPVSVIAQSAWTIYKEDNGLGINTAWSIKASPDGTVWCAGDNGVFCFDGGIWYDYTNLAIYKMGIAINDDSIIWFGGSKGLTKYDGFEWKSYTEDDGFTSNGFNNLGVDSNGVVWSGARYGGILRFDGINMRLFTTEDGLYDNYVSRVLVLQDGDVWCRYGDPLFCEGNPEDENWSCPYGGVSHFDGEKWETFDIDDGLLSNRVYSMAVNNNGYIFISYPYTSGISMYNGEYWETISTEYGGELAFDNNNVLWSVWSGGLDENERLRSFNSGIWIKNYGMPYSFFVNSIDIDSNGVIWFATYNGVFRFDPLITLTEEDISLPEEFEIIGNYPNPFNSSTTISFELPESSWTSLQIYNTAGQKIATLVDGLIPAGNNKVLFDGIGFPSGLYFARLNANGTVITTSMLLIK